MGQRWHVREVSASGLLYDGVWTRTGPRSFVAEWRQVGSRDVIRDTIDVERLNDDTVVLYRRGLNGRYFGTLSADGRFVSGHASWYGAGDNWSAEIEKEQVSASAGPQAKAPVPRIVAVPRLDPNASWRVREVTASGAAFEGVWTRTGAHSFSAEWRAVGSRNTIRDRIEIERQYGLRDGARIGTVTSGTLSPVLKKGIAMGYVPVGMSAVGTEVQIKVRDMLVAAEIVKPPFVRSG